MKKYNTILFTNLLRNLLKRIKFELIVQNDELHKILDYYLSAVITFKLFMVVYDFYTNIFEISNLPLANNQSNKETDGSYVYSNPP